MPFGAARCPGPFPVGRGIPPPQHPTHSALRSSRLWLSTIPQTRHPRSATLGDWLSPTAWRIEATVRGLLVRGKERKGGEGRRGDEREEKERGKDGELGKGREGRGKGEVGEGRGLVPPPGHELFARRPCSTCMWWRTKDVVQSIFEYGWPIHVVHAV